jgi:hypothetical protein
MFMGMFLGEPRNITEEHKSAWTSGLRNIRAYVPQGTEEHNRTYVPRRTEEHNRTYVHRGTEEHKGLMFLGEPRGT